MIDLLGKRNLGDKSYPTGQAIVPKVGSSITFVAERKLEDGNTTIKINTLFIFIY